MSARTFSWISLIAACAVTLIHNLWMSPWMLDDAFIYFRYVEHWAAGHGLVFNIGEGPVEGNTSFLWTVLLTLGRALGCETVSLSLVLGHVISFAVLLLVNQSWRWLDRVDRGSAALATLFLGTCGVFTPWARSGMDTSLFALLVCAQLIVYVRAKEAPQRMWHWVCVGLLFSLVGINRIDAVLIVGVLGLDALLTGRWRGLLVASAVFVVLFGIYFAWRYSYFGYLLPNPAYAKVGMTTAQLVRGLHYVGNAAYVLLPLLLLCVTAGRSWLREWRHYLVIPGLLIVYALYVVSVGGDIMPAFRFFTPVVPILCIVAAMALGVRATRLRWIGAVVVVGYGLFMIEREISPVIRGDTVAYNGKISGTWLRENAPEGSVIATNTAGTVVYYSGLRAIDMLGLNDLHIARVEMPDMGKGLAGHEKGDGEYILKKRPEFIMLGSSAGWAATKIQPQPPFPGDRQIWANPKFHEDYELLYREGETVWPNWVRLGYFGFYVRKDVAARFKKDK